MSEIVYAQRLSSNITKIPLSKLKSESLTLQQQLVEHAKENTAIAHHKGTDNHAQYCACDSTDRK